MALIQKETNINHCHPEGAGVPPHPHVCWGIHELGRYGQDDNPLLGNFRWT